MMRMRSRRSMKPGWEVSTSRGLLTWDSILVPSPPFLWMSFSKPGTNIDMVAWDWANQSSLGLSIFQSFQLSWLKCWTDYVTDGISSVKQYKCWTDCHWCHQLCQMHLTLLARKPDTNTEMTMPLILAQPNTLVLSFQKNWYKYWNNHANDF